MPLGTFARRYFSLVGFAVLGTLLLAASSPAADIGLRMRFGLKDEKPTKWDGTIDVSPGRVTHIGGWRFARGDSIDGTAGWKASTHVLAQPGRGNNQKKAAAAAAARAAGKPQPMADNGVIVSMTDVDDTTRVTIKTDQGEVTFALADIKYGDVLEKLDG